MSIITMIFSIAPAVAPIIGGWAHVAFGWRAVFAVMTLCGLVFAFSAWAKLPETHLPQARVPFNARNLVATSLTVLRHPEFLMLAIAAAVNFGSLAVYIGSAPAIVEMHWGKGETDYFMLFLPVISGILTGAIISTIFARRLNLLLQVRIGMMITFIGSLARAVIHAGFDEVPILLQQGLLWFSGIGAQFAFPALTLRMLDLFPAARGTAAAAQSFTALLITAFTFGVVAPNVLAHLGWLAWTSLVYACIASTCWYLSRRWHAANIPM
jgi:DHA1 family bicyclomycin/chloramphenicol resistance-like MFS transporter